MKLSKAVSIKVFVPAIALITIFFFGCQAKIDHENGVKKSGVKQENKNFSVSQANQKDTSFRISNDEVEKFFQEGNKYSKDGRFLLAIESYQKALELNDYSPSVHYNLANVYVAVDKITDAIKEYKLAIKLSPMITDYHRNLGFAYALQENGDMAKMKYNELKKIDPAKAEELMHWIQKGPKGG